MSGGGGMKERVVMEGWRVVEGPRGSGGGAMEGGQGGRRLQVPPGTSPLAFCNKQDKSSHPGDSAFTCIKVGQC